MPASARLLCLLKILDIAVSLWLEETWSDFNIFDTKVKTYFRNLQSKARLFLSPRVTGATLQNRKHGNRIFSFARVTAKMSAACISFWKTMQYRSICDLNFAVYRCYLKLLQLAWIAIFCFVTLFQILCITSCLSFCHCFVIVNACAVVGRRLMQWTASYRVELAETKPEIERPVSVGNGG